jgi:hypothetical protein
MRRKGNPVGEPISKPRISGLGGVEITSKHLLLYESLSLQPGGARLSSSIAGMSF